MSEMKQLWCAAALMTGASVLVVSPAVADITCWYNDAGNYTGADNADGRYPRGKLIKTGSNGDYAWAYTIDAQDGSSCPKTRPSQ